MTFRIFMSRARPMTEQDQFMLLARFLIETNTYKFNHVVIEQLLRRHPRKVGRKYNSKVIDTNKLLHDECQHTDNIIFLHHHFFWDDDMKSPCLPFDEPNNNTRIDGCHFKIITAIMISLVRTIKMFCLSNVVYAVKSGELWLFHSW